MNRILPGPLRRFVLINFYFKLCQHASAGSQSTEQQICLEKKNYLFVTDINSKINSSNFLKRKTINKPPTNEHPNNTVPTVWHSEILPAASLYPALYHHEQKTLLRSNICPFPNVWITAFATVKGPQFTECFSENFGSYFELGSEVFIFHEKCQEGSWRYSLSI